ncbi:MAG TPA: PIN domain-containing protein [Chloroflexota bacterium]|jgi:predicted nucleic acid-binding protein
MILIDTGGLLAALDPRQADHDLAARVVVRPQRRLLSPFVLAELDYLLARHGGQPEEIKLLRDVGRGVYELQTFSPADVAAAQAIIEHYTDLRLGLADASIIVLAQRHRCYDLLTLDQRHFRAVLGPGGKPFRLLPADDNSA